MLKSKNQVILFVNYGYNGFYDFRSSENIESEQEVMCQNMAILGFLILYGALYMQISMRVVQLF